MYEATAKTIDYFGDYTVSQIELGISKDVVLFLIIIKQCALCHVDFKKHITIIRSLCVHAAVSPCIRQADIL